MVKRRKTAVPFARIVELKENGVSDKEIAKRLKVKVRNIYAVVSANNVGCGSLTDYANFCAKNNGYNDHKDYENSLARDKGCLDKYMFVRFKEYINDPDNDPKDFFQIFATRRGLGDSSEYHEEFENECKVNDLGGNLVMNDSSYDQVRFENSVRLNGLNIDQEVISNSTDILEDLLKGEMTLILSKSLNVLDKRDKAVIIGRFYDGKTLQEIGLEMGLTGERVRQIETRALFRLNKMISSYLSD